MPKNTEKPIDSKVDKDSLFSDFHASDKYVSTKREDWDEKENIFFCKNPDEITEDETKSNINDPRLATYALERSGRVCAQLPTGKPFALTKNDRGKNKLMTLVLNKWVYPNAKSQFPLITKFKMMDMYSYIYGSSFGLVDWVVDKKKGYIGPDLFLLNIRDVFPQAGAISLEDSDYIYVSTLKTKEWLKSRDSDTWKNIDKVLKRTKGTSRSEMSSERISTRYADFYNSYDAGGKDNPYVELITRYERDKWITFEPESREIIREIENPHKNGELPVVSKHCFPLLDDFFGLGDVERGATLQKAMDSLINLYFDGVKMQLFPPLQINPDEVVASSIKMRPGTKMYMDRPNQSVQAMAVSDKSLSTFQSTYNFLLGALENTNGTSSTQVAQQYDSTAGKTPQALRMQQARENTRDLMDRYQMEVTVQNVIEKFVNLQANKMEAPLILSLFSAEVEQIAKEFPDIVEFFESGEGAKLTIDKELLKGKYRFEVDSGSMIKRDDELELANLNTMLQVVLQNAQINPQTGRVMSPLINIMEENGKKLNTAELFKQWVIKAGINDWDKIIIEDQEEEMTGGEQGEQGVPIDQVEEEVAEFEQQLGGMQQPTQEQVPQGGIYA
ncbi:MAG TPA: hypothetical protein P5098_02205 [Candidatus Dojkabacteria bacterium]|nr:hypothetical protein [Candidatus Dojkabacteria bacterium]